MVDCGPACSMPNVASTPVVGLGSRGALGGEGLGYAGLGFGLGGLVNGGLGFGGLGLGGLLGYGGLPGNGGRGVAENSGSLGIPAGVVPSCINQIPPSELLIQPRSCVVTIPGPILSASCEPVAVGGNTPCAVGNRFGGYGTLGCASNGLWGTGAWGRGGLLGNYRGCGKGFLGCRGSVCF